ncbi:MAG TPA: hypothetical protein VFF73_17645 [Planctomycetota bacterium]|nr:hypothetical protein [Planctomycetota bacterium]
MFSLAGLSVARLSVARLSVALVLVLAPLALAQDTKERESDTTVKDALEERSLTFKLDETPCPAFFEFLRSQADIDVVVDATSANAVAAVGSNLTLISRDLKLKDIFDKVATKLGVGWQVWHGAVWLTEKGKKIQEEPRVKPSNGLAKRLAEQKVTLDLDDKSLTYVADTLEQLTEQSFSIDEKVKGDQVKVTLHLSEANLADAMAALCRLAGVELEAKDNLNVFKKRR